MSIPAAMPLPVTSAMTMPSGRPRRRAAGTGRRSRRRSRGPPRSGSPARNPDVRSRRATRSCAGSRAWASSSSIRASAAGLGAAPPSPAAERRKRRDDSESTTAGPLRVSDASASRPRNGSASTSRRSVPSPSSGGPGVAEDARDGNPAGVLDGERPAREPAAEGAKEARIRRDSRGIEPGAVVGHGRPGRARQTAAMAGPAIRMHDEQSVEAGPLQHARHRGLGPHSWTSVWRSARRRWSRIEGGPASLRSGGVSPCIIRTIECSATSPELAMNVRPAEVDEQVAGTAVVQPAHGLDQPLEVRCIELAVERDDRDRDAAVDLVDRGLQAIYRSSLGRGSSERVSVRILPPPGRGGWVSRVGPQRA